MKTRLLVVFGVLPLICPSLEIRAQKRVTVTHHDPSQAFPGLTTEFTGRVSYASPNPSFRIFDNDGRILASWRAKWRGWSFSYLIKPLPRIGFLAAVRSDEDGRQLLVDVDWAGNARWVFDPTSRGLDFHHDFQRLASGNTLVLTQRTRSAPSIKPGPILDDVIIEVTPSGAVVWEWSTVDHASMLPLASTEWTYIFGLSLASVFHTNSIQSLPSNRWEATDPRFRAGNILVSQRDTNSVFIIDKQTGDVVWSYKGAVGQHHARMLPVDLPGAGNILIYDNGGAAGAPPIIRNFSRIVEFDPTTGQEVWTYECDAQSPHACSGSGFVPLFFAAFTGSAQRMPNGNTLISDSTFGRVFEVTTTGELVWECQTAVGSQVYRAYRVSPDWWIHGGEPFLW